MVQTQIDSLADLENIVGVGKARAEKYGDEFLRCSKRQNRKANMKRTGNLFDHIADRENLRWAVIKALRGKRHRPDARALVARLETELKQLRAELLDGTIPLGSYRQFVIHDPKERVITAPCFRERVLHHAIMNVCEPVFERRLIDDTFACRRGRGRLAALDRAARFASRFGYFLKLDVRKYFDSIPHDLLVTRLSRLIKDPRLQSLFDRIIGCFRGELGRGLPIGSLTSQHLANLYLDDFDRFVKERRRVKGYVRYMDDMVLWSKSRTELSELASESAVVLRETLSLLLKPIALNRSSHGVDFLGCRVYDNRISLSRRSRQRFSRKLAALRVAVTARGD